MKSYFSVFLLLFTTSLFGQKINLYFLSPEIGTWTFTSKEVTYLNTGKDGVRLPLGVGVANLSFGGDLQVDGILVGFKSGFTTQVGGNSYRLDTYESIHKGTFFTGLAELLPLSIYDPESRFNLVTPHIEVSRYWGTDIELTYYDDGGKAHHIWSGSGVQKFIALGARYSTRKLFGSDGLQFSITTLGGMMKSGKDKAQIAARISFKVIKKIMN